MIYDLLTMREKNTLGATIVDERVSSLNKYGIIEMRNNKYETILNLFFNKYSDGKFSSINYGDTIKSFDLLLTINQTKETYGLQVKSAVIKNRRIKWYQMNKITDIIVGDTQEVVLDVIVDCFNERLDKDAQDYGINVFKSWYFIKGHSNIVLYEKEIYKIDRKKCIIKSFKKDKSLEFECEGRMYLFEYANHTLHMRDERENDYLDIFYSPELKDFAEIADLVLEEHFTKGSVPNRKLPFEDAFYYNRNDVRALVSVMTSYPEYMLKSKDKVTSITTPNGIMNVVKKTNHVYVLKNSIISTHCKMFDVLYDEGLVTDNGILLRSLRLRTIKDVQDYLKRKQKGK